MENKDLNLILFGNMRIEQDGAELPAPRLKKSLWLLAILALRCEQNVPRDWLAETLWPDSFAPLATLRRALTDLRHILGPASHVLIAPTVQTLRFNADACRVDVLEFDAAAQQTDINSLGKAIELYRGPLMGACSLPWIAQERAVRQETYLRVLESAATLYRQSGDNRQAARALERAIAGDRYNENLHRMWMQVLREAGERGEAIQVYRDLCLRLRRELDTEPDADTTRLYQDISAARSCPPSVQGEVSRHRGVEAAANANCSRDEEDSGRQTTEADAAQADTSPPQSAIVVSTSERVLVLPHPLTELIGRDTEREAIRRHLQRSRLVTLTGMGGIGKTHLAIQSGRDLQTDFVHGVAFVELAHISDADSAIRAIAAALDIREETTSPPLNGLQAALHDRALLLILDNCEHLVEACARLSAALLQTCPHLRILATSRQALGLTGEGVLDVPPLRLPSPDSRPFPPDDIALFVAQYPALRLFVARAAEVFPAFAVTPQNLAAIVGICATLEGIPLALELAAARLRTLSAAQIQERARDRFGLLSQGNRGARPHQQTLRAMLDWSYDLLTPAERMLFRRLAAFARGWTLEAAEAACADAAGLVPRPAILDILTRLVEKSLVLSEEEDGGARRYRMLETVREYAEEKAVCSGEHDRQRGAHRDYFLALLAQVYTARYGAGQQTYLQTAQREYDNLRAALHFCMEERQACEQDAEKGLLLAGYLQDYWWTRGLLQEGQQTLEAMLRHPCAQGSSRARAFALNGAGVITWLRGQNTTAIARLEEGLEIRRRFGDRREAAIVMGNLGGVYREMEEHATSRAVEEESLAIFRELNLPWNIASALTNVASAALHQGDGATAQAYYEEAVALRREIGDRRGAGISLCGLGQTLAEQDESERALTCYEESLTLLRECRELPNLSVTLLSVGRLHRRCGRSEEACRAYGEALEICRETGDALTATLLCDLALLFHQREDDTLAAILLYAARAQERQNGTTLTCEERREGAQLDTNLHLRLGQSACEAAMNQSATLGLEGILSLLVERQAVTE